MRTLLPLVLLVRFTSAQNAQSGPETKLVELEKNLPELPDLNIGNIRDFLQLGNLTVGDIDLSKFDPKAIQEAIRDFANSSGLGKLPSLPDLTQGLPNLPQGLPNLPQGLPDFSQGLPDLSQGLPNLALPDLSSLGSRLTNLTDFKLPSALQNVTAPLDPNQLANLGLLAKLSGLSQQNGTPANALEKLQQVVQQQTARRLLAAQHQRRLAAQEAPALREALNGFNQALNSAILAASAKRRLSAVEAQAALYPQYGLKKPAALQSAQQSEVLKNSLNKIFGNRPIPTAEALERLEAAAKGRRLGATWFEHTLQALVGSEKMPSADWKVDVQNAANDLAKTLEDMAQNLRNGNIADRLESWLRDAGSRRRLEAEYFEQGPSQTSGNEELQQIGLPNIFPGMGLLPPGSPLLLNGMGIPTLPAVPALNYFNPMSMAGLSGLNIPGLTNALGTLGVRRRLEEIAGNPSDPLHSNLMAALKSSGVSATASAAAPTAIKPLGPTALNFTSLMANPGVAKPNTLIGTPDMLGNLGKDTPQEQTGGSDTQHNARQTGSVDLLGALADPSKILASLTGGGQVPTIGQMPGLGSLPGIGQMPGISNLPAMPSMGADLAKNLEGMLGQQNAGFATLLGKLASDPSALTNLMGALSSTQQPNGASSGIQNLIGSLSPLAGAQGGGSPQNLMGSLHSAQNLMGSLGSAQPNTLPGALGAQPKNLMGAADATQIKNLIGSISQAPHQPQNLMGSLSGTESSGSPQAHNLIGSLISGDAKNALGTGDASTIQHLMGSLNPEQAQNAGGTINPPTPASQSNDFMKLLGQGVDVMGILNGLNASDPSSLIAKLPQGDHLLSELSKVSGSMPSLGQAGDLKNILGDPSKITEALNNFTHVMQAAGDPSKLISGLMSGNQAMQDLGSLLNASNMTKDTPRQTKDVPKASLQSGGLPESVVNVLSHPSAVGEAVHSEGQSVKNALNSLTQSG